VFRSERAFVVFAGVSAPQSKSMEQEKQRVVSKRVLCRPCDSRLKAISNKTSAIKKTYYTAN
jgi:hypothetical protein